MNRRAVHFLVLALLVVVFGSVLAWVVLGRPETGIDDADIFLVYARHLADGHGFVYNVGGERVEGFTSMLWTLVCAIVFTCTRQVEIPLYLINVLLGAATIWACARRAGSPAVFFILLLSMPAWFAWCQVTLMETGLWCLLLTLTTLAVVERRGMAIAGLMPLLVLARPESMLWGGWLVLMFGCAVAVEQGWRNAAKAVIVPAFAFCAALLALVLFRQGYFGYPVPNTYYAKVTPSLSTNLWNGTGYLLRYLFSHPAVLPATLTVAWIVFRGLWKRRGELDDATLLALCILPGFAIPVLVGGDHFGGFRFYQPLWPVLCLLAANAWAARLAAFPPVKVRISLTALVLIGWLLFPFTGWMTHEFRIASGGRETGTALSVMFGDLEEYPTVATITAGGRKYAYPGTVLDLMGLNATDMAHAPGPRTGFKNHTAFNRDIFYQWHPDIVLCGEDPEFDDRVLKGLFADARFQQQYVKRSLTRNNRAVEAYYARRLLARLPDVSRTDRP